MKKLITAAALSFCTVPGFAQKGFYLKPIAGIGLTNARMDSYGTNPQPDVSMGYRLQAGVGYRSGNWGIETGLSYFTTGYQWKSRFTEDNFNPGTGQGQGSPFDVRAVYRHIGLPVLLGYHLPLTSRWGLEPSLGVEMTYNTGATAVLTGGIDDRIDLKGDDFTDINRRFSLFGVAQLHASYKLQGKLSLAGGFSGRYMVSNLVKKPEGPVPYDAQQRHYLLTFDLGIIYRL